MFWHIDTDIVSLIVITALLIYYSKTLPDREDTLRNKRFRWCLQTGIVITVIDIAASLIMEVAVSRLIYHFVMTLYFISVEMVIVVWILYAIVILYHDDINRGKIVSRIVIISYIAYGLFVCTNPWTGLFYTLGEDNVYQRGPLFMLMIVLYTVYAIALLTLILVRWKHIPKDYSALVLLLEPFILAVGITVQLMIPGWLMVMPAYMICLVLAFLFLQVGHTRSNKELLESISKTAVTDQLTGLYNRTGMNERIQKSIIEDYGRTCFILMIDLDDLKRINDTMGHSEGDRAIKAVANQLKRHFRETDMVARYGGDEFLVYLTGDLRDALVHSSIRRLIEKLSSLRIGENDEVSINVSIGAVLGIVGRDSFEELCNKADTALYYVKRHGKNNYAFFSPEMNQQEGMNGIST